MGMMQKEGRGVDYQSSGGRSSHRTEERDPFPP